MFNLLSSIDFKQLEKKEILFLVLHQLSMFAGLHSLLPFPQTHATPVPRDTL